MRDRREGANRAPGRVQAVPLVDAARGLPAGGNVQRRPLRARCACVVFFALQGLNASDAWVRTVVDGWSRHGLIESCSDGFLERDGGGGLGRALLRLNLVRVSPTFDLPP